MLTQIANWGVELALIRTKVGAEFRVAETLGGTADGCRFFGTYGYFDLAVLRCISLLNTPYLVLLDREITESAPFRFFAEHTNHSRTQFENDLDRWPVAILCLAKIQESALREQNAGDIRWQAAARVRATFPDGHVFFGLGYSEILLIAGGDNLPELLAKVTRLRELRRPQASLPLFAKTTTFPLLSCSLVHSSEAYQKIKGKIEPVITGTCEPAVEQQIASAIQGRGLVIKNVYGKSDFLLSWPNPVTLAQLAAFLTEFRREWGEAGGLTRTTTYLETTLGGEGGELARKAPKPRVAQPRPTGLMTPRDEKRLFRQLSEIESRPLRAALSDLILRLSACASDCRLGPHFMDMANTFPFMSSLVGHLKKGDPRESEAAFTAEAVAHIARVAINQRYAGLEFHPETLAHSHMPLLCDIRTIVAAATCVPRHIFDHLLPGKTASQTWSGFVVFGGESSPQFLHQGVLALPPASLFTPVEEWWKITHEAAHAVFKALEVYNHIPKLYRAHVAAALPNDLIDDYHLINELFANWFDWKYIFQSDTKFYLERIWTSWIRLPIVQKSKAQYLARSFAVFICPRLAEFGRTFDRRWVETGLPWMRSRWEEFRRVLQEVPTAKEYFAEITDVELRNTFDLVRHTSHIIRFFDTSFETVTGTTGLYRRLHPQYSRLEKHIKMLLSGKVITNQIPDPCRLHLELLKRLHGSSFKLSTEIAYLFSLEHTYATAVRRLSSV